MARAIISCSIRDYYRLQIRSVEILSRKQAPPMTSKACRTYIGFATSAPLPSTCGSATSGSHRSCRRQLWGMISGIAAHRDQSRSLGSTASRRSFAAGSLRCRYISAPASLDGSATWRHLMKAMGATSPASSCARFCFKSSSTRGRRPPTAINRAPRMLSTQHGQCAMSSSCAEAAHLFASQDGADASKTRSSTRTFWGKDPGLKCPST